MFEQKVYDDPAPADYADGRHKSWVWHNLCESQCDSAELKMILVPFRKQNSDIEINVTRPMWSKYMTLYLGACYLRPTHCI